MHTKTLKTFLEKSRETRRGKEEKEKRKKKKTRRKLRVNLQREWSPCFFRAVDTSIFEKLTIHPVCLCKQNGIADWIRKK